MGKAVHSWTFPTTIWTSLTSRTISKANDDEEEEERNDLGRRRRKNCCGNPSVNPG